MKKFILITVLIFVSIGLFGQLSLINVGAAANDHTGDALRTAFQKVNLGITQINTNTSNILLKVPYTGATTNLNLGTNSLLLTGSIGATGSRVTKGWFTNLETTNLPTVNGGTLKSALSLTSTDVGLNNLTNKLQVELEDSADHAHTNSYATGKMLADGLATKLGTADTVTLSSITPLLVDTATMFTMAIGHGAAHLAIDTTGVTVGYDLGGTFIGGSDTTGLTETILVLEASKNAPSVYINVYWGTTYGTPLDSLYTNPLQITSTSTGTSGTTGFKNQKVPPKRWIWCAVAKVPALGAKPQFSRGAVIGYKIPTY